MKGDFWIYIFAIIITIIYFGLPLMNMMGLTLDKLIK